MSKNTNKIDGWLIIDKPLNLGSTQVVSKVKWALSPAKIGHAGTLDPLASGVLPIALGHASKLIPYVMEGAKVYDFQVTWGCETDTDDAAGSIIQESPNRPTESEIRQVLPEFSGEILQQPPAYSALKIDGERAYDLARRGQEVALSPRPVQIDSLTLLSANRDTADFRVVCGKGTYVRSLGRDLGRRLGCYGYITRLRRVACGPFRIEDAIGLDAFSEKNPSIVPLPIETPLGQMPRFCLSAEICRRLQQGQRIPLREVADLNPETLGEGIVVCLYDSERLIGLGRIQHKVLHPYRIFS